MRQKNINLISSASSRYKRKVKKRPWNTSKRWLKFALIEGVYSKNKLWNTWTAILKTSALLRLQVKTFSIHNECVPLTISYHLYFLHISKVWNMLHHGSVGWVQSKESYFNQSEIGIGDKTFPVELQVIVPLNRKCAWAETLQL